MTSAIHCSSTAPWPDKAGPSSGGAQLTADNVRALAASSSSKPSMITSQVPTTPKRKRFVGLDQAASARELQEQSADDSVLNTPRRGRRLAGIDMGWGSPLLTEKEATAPQTFPRMEKRPRGRPPKRTVRVQAEDDVPVTPSKRRGADLYGADSWPSLVDSQGWASAAVHGRVPKTAGPSSSANGSPEPDSAFDHLPASSSSSSSTGFAPRYDAMSLFARAGRGASAAEPRKVLVPVEVKGMGRIAVHMELASQIAGVDGAPASDQLVASSSSEMGASSSSASCGTTTSSQPTSVMTPCPSGPSPSFSIASQFPSSPASSPSSGRHTEALARLEKVMGKKPASDSQRWAQGSLKPRLGGFDNCDSSLPTLDWPDSPTGPWAMAGSHLNGTRETRLQGIARWLDGDDEDSAVPAPVTVKREDGALEPSAFYSADPIASKPRTIHHQHPMITKALRDRARKAAAAQAESPSKSGRSSPDKARREARRQAGARKLAKADSRQRKGFERRALRQRGTKLGQVSTPKRVSPSKAGALVTPKTASPFIGCGCGIDDEVGDMVQCDACNHWFHLFCLGLASVEELDAEWFCDGCCERALLGLSPSTASTITLPPGSASTSSIGSTPLIHRGGIIPAEIHNGLPVFAQPGDTPVPLRMAGGLSTALALAPSPSMFGAQHRQQQLALGANRLRASRIGKYSSEAGSPLARKSALPDMRLAAGAVHQDDSQTPTGRARLNDAMATPMLFAAVNDGPDDWATSGVAPSRRRNAHTTPSPRLSHAATGSTRGTRGSGDSARRHRRQISGLESDDERHVDLDDIFSTPSRIFGGSSSWSQRGTGASSSATHVGLQTPSRRAREHTRDWGLATPGRNLLGSSFSGDHSLSGTGGLPSLIFTSGGLDHFDGQLAASGGGSERHWQLQSPTSSTRAGRARQDSGMPSTPELIPQRPAAHGAGATSSIRGSYHRSSGSGGSRRRDEQRALESDDLPSSSPYPRTPSFSGGDSPSYRRGSDAMERFMAGMAGPGTPMGSSRRLAKIAGLGHGPAPTSAGRAARQRLSSNAEALGSGEELGGALIDSRKASNGHGQRNPSFGLVGLGLDDFLDFE